MMDIPQATFSEKKSAIELCFDPDKYLPRRGTAITAGLYSWHPTCFQNTDKKYFGFHVDSVLSLCFTWLLNI